MPLHALMHSPILLFGTVLSLFLISTVIVVAQILVREKKRPISELIRLCSERSPEWQTYWNEFESRFGEKILLYIYREFKMLLRYSYVQEYDEIIKDLRQDVYIKLLKDDAKALHRFRGDSERSFHAFLYVTAKNTVYNYAKSNKNKNHITFTKLETKRTNSENDHETLNTFDPATNDDLEAIEQKELREFIMTRVRECYDSRNLERDLLVFEKYCLDGYTSKEVQALFNLNIKPSAIDTIVDRMKKKLGKSLKK